MPRHIRSVTARRPRKIARRPVKPAAPAVVPSASAHKLELFDALRQAFQSTPEIPETAERTRERYVSALESLADYLEDIGAEEAWTERIDELAWALEDLTKGALPPVLTPTGSESRLPPAREPSSG
jgi:hypothetical protein